MAGLSLLKACTRAAAFFTNGRKLPAESDWSANLGNQSGPLVSNANKSGCGGGAMPIWRGGQRERDVGAHCRSNSPLLIPRARGADAASERGMKDTAVPRSTGVMLLQLSVPWRSAKRVQWPIAAARGLASGRFPRGISPVLGSGITVPDPNPPRVYDAMGGALVNPVEGRCRARHAACAAPTARPAARATKLGRGHVAPRLHLQVLATAVTDYRTDRNADDHGHYHVALASIRVSPSRSR